MKLFRITIVFLYFTLGLDMDVFVVGQHTMMMSSSGPEMFPILWSSKYLDMHFFLNRIVSVLNCSCHKYDAAASVSCQVFHSH